jgi:predicted  nucleic acid-binding Zn-ribbon protein
VETAVINSVVRLISEEALALVVLLALIFQLFYMNKAIERVEKAVSRLKEDIEALERKKVDKEVHLQDVSGWRWEIQRLEERMEKFFDRLTELIQLLKEK